MRNRKAENRPLMKVICSLLLFALCLSALMISCYEYFLITVKSMLQWLFISLCAVIVTIFAVLFALESPYLGWNYNEPETAVLGVAFHSFEWLFVRAASIILVGAIIGVFLTWKKE